MGIKCTILHGLRDDLNTVLLEEILLVGDTGDFAPQIKLDDFLLLREPGRHETLMLGNVRNCLIHTVLNEHRPGDLV